MNFKYRSKSNIDKWNDFKSVSKLSLIIDTILKYQ